MQIDQWIASWRDLVNPRFVFCDPTSRSAHLERLAGEGFSGRVLMVRRGGWEHGGFRTVLVAHADSLHASAAALHWAADVRDALPEPATADIYLFLEIASASLEDCLRLEADDQYCRKYVRRPEESGEEFLKRTFLAAPVPPDEWARWLILSRPRSFKRPMCTVGFPPKSRSIGVRP